MPEWTPHRVDSASHPNLDGPDPSLLKPETRPAGHRVGTLAAAQAVRDGGWGASSNWRPLRRWGLPPQSLLVLSSLATALVRVGAAPTLARAFPAAFQLIMLGGSISGGIREGGHSPHPRSASSSSMMAFMRLGAAPAL